MKQRLIVALVLVSGLVSLLPVAPTRVAAIEAPTSETLAVELVGEEGVALAALEAAVEASGLEGNVELRAGGWAEITVEAAASAIDALLTTVDALGVSGELVPDVTVRPLLTPDDPGAGWNLTDSRDVAGCERGEWFTYDSATGAVKDGPFPYRRSVGGTADCAGAGVARAWAKSRGAGTVIAVVDTGSINHPDLPTPIGGYDFISNSLVAEDGDGRDANPADTGDGITSTENTSAGSPYYGCGSRSSSWHGGHVAGIALGRTGDGVGIAGVAPEADLLAVRVLGKCGGSMLDVADAIRWSAGLAVPGVSDNAHPADIINLSLGGKMVDEYGRYNQTCPAYMQEAVSAAIAAGSILVAAAGNDGATSLRDASYMTPANCDGVIVVGAADRAGRMARYSNTGSLLTILAQGGATSDMFGRPSLVNSSVDSGAYEPSGAAWRGYQGTSMATPHVAGALALLRALDPDLDGEAARALLRRTAAPFDWGSACAYNNTCGAGVLDVGDLIAAVSTPAPTPEPTPDLTPEPTPDPTPEPTPDPVADGISLLAPLSGVVGDTLTVRATAISGLPVTLRAAGACSLSGETLLAERAGRCTLQASTAGSSAYLPASAETTITVERRATSISLALPTELRRGETLTLTGAHSDALPISYRSLTSTICSVSGDQLRALAAGLCTVEAESSGTDDLLPTSTTADLMVNEPLRVAQILTLFAPETIRVDDRILIEALSDADLPVTLESATPEICRLSATALTALRAGRCALVLLQSGNDDYLPAELKAEIEILRLDGILEISLPDKAIAGSLIGYRALSSEGSVVDWQSLTPAICTTTDTGLRTLLPGACRVAASIEATARRTAARVEAEISVAPRTAQISLTLPATLAVGNALTLNASVDSGAAVQITSATPAICSVDGVRLTALAVGLCRLQSSAAALGAYGSAERDVEINVTPLAAMELASGAARVRMRTVALGLTVPSWATRATIAWGAARAVNLSLTATSITLPSGDGNKVAKITFFGPGQSVVVSDSIILDASAPTAKVTITRIAVGQADLRVTLTDLSGADGFRVSIGNTTTPGAWQTAGSTVRLSGPKGAAIFVQTRDTLGNLAWIRVGVLPSR